MYPVLKHPNTPTTLQYKTPYECIAEGTKHELRQSPDSVEQLRTLLKSAKSPVAEEVLKEIGVSLGLNVLKCYLLCLFH